MALTPRTPVIWPLTVTTLNRSFSHLSGTVYLPYSEIINLDIGIAQVFGDSIFWGLNINDNTSFLTKDAKRTNNISNRSIDNGNISLPLVHSHWVPFRSLQLVQHIAVGVDSEVISLWTPSEREDVLSHGVKRSTGLLAWNNMGAVEDVSCTPHCKKQIKIYDFNNRARAGDASVLLSLRVGKDLCKKFQNYLNGYLAQKKWNNRDVGGAYIFLLS